MKIGLCWQFAIFLFYSTMLFASLAACPCFADGCYMIELCRDRSLTD